MELKGGVSANLQVTESAIFFQEAIGEYMSNHNCVEYFLLPVNYTEYKRYLSTITFFSWEILVLTRYKIIIHFSESEIITVSS